MSLFSELREDIRLARLNNPSYEPFFALLGIASGLFKVCLLAGFGLAIWHILYGYDKQATIGSQTQGMPVTSAVAVVPDIAALTPERIEMFKQFAIVNRPAGAETLTASQAPGLSAVVDTVIGTEIDSHTDTRIAVADITTANESPIVGIVSSHSESAEPDAELVVTRKDPQARLYDEDAIRIKSNKMLEALLGILEENVRPPLALNPAASSTVVVANDDSSVVTLASELDTASAADAVLVKKDGVYEDEWMLEQKSALYTIQIGSTVNRSFLVRFAKLLPWDQPASVYQFLYREKPEYGLSYGLFDTSRQANAALGKLSQKIRRYGAFVRKVEVIQSQMTRMSETLAGNK